MIHLPVPQHGAYVAEMRPGTFATGCARALPAGAWRTAAAFACLLAVCAAAAASPGGRFVLLRDLDGDERRERVVLRPARNLALSVRRGHRLLWRGIPRRWKPWKLAIADVDGDGKCEIVLGVHKATRFFPKPHDCLFVYGWDGRRAYPKWLGSALSKPFTDFALADLDGDGRDELVSVERTRDDRRCLVVYSWRGFGFAGEQRPGTWKHLRIVASGRGRVLLLADGKRLFLRR